MLPADTVIQREIPVIRKIIADETWLEAERRGCPVSSDDYVVREKVCTIVLQIGQQLRDSITRNLPAGGQAILPESTTNSINNEPNSATSNETLSWEI